MRVLVLTLMILLLPLRGWMGDSMAMGSAAEAAASAHCAGHTDVAAATHSAHAEPEGMGHGQADGDIDAATADDASHTHDLCDVCNVPALAQAFPAAASERAQPTLAVESAVAFLSHLPHGEHKPPIA